MRAINNARIQLLATALRNLGVAAIVAGSFAPLASGNVSFPLMVIGQVVGVGFITLARTVLGRLL